MTGRLPDFLGIGAQRSGSTTLWYLLGGHPRIWTPARKELHFFDDRDGDYSAGPESYAAHFAQAPPDAIVGEFTPDYLFAPHACDRIKEVIPTVRLLAILRDPVERAWSHYWFSVQRGREWLPFQEALGREEERLSSGRPEWESWFSYVKRGQYVDQLRRFEYAFSRDQLHVVLLEDLRSAPSRTMAKVFPHLGLDPSEVNLMPEPRPRNRGAHPRLRRVHYETMRARGWSERHGPLVHQGVRVLTGLSKHLNRTRSVPKLDERTRHQLTRIFAGSNRELAEWLGRGLPWQGVER